MQNGPSQVTSGNIAPAISGPKKDKDTLVLSGFVLSLAAVIGAFWYYSSSDSPYQAPPSNTDKLNGAEVSQVLKSSNPLVTPVSLESATIQAAPVSSSRTGTVHTDLFFEPGRKGLTDEATSSLQEQAELLKADPNMGVLIQGYTDQRGSASYNMKLGMKRAESAKEALLKAGVAEHQIKAVSLGEEGVLCIDHSDVCRQMNRRVHLEIRTIGQEHMVPQPLTETAPVVESTQASIEPDEATNESATIIDQLIPPANASEGDNGGSPPLEPASGS